MMVVELGLLPPASDQGFSPRKAGFVTMCSFMCFGSIPLLPYLVGLFPHVNMSSEVQLGIAVVSTIITLFLLGAYKGHVVQGGRAAWWKSGFLMAANGSLAAAVGFLCGYLISNFMDLPPGAG
jgi:VIT1/CCC1 family predicted Fe2+/Mn2+ transporter